MKRRAFTTLLGGATLRRHPMLPGVATPIIDRLDGRRFVAVTSSAANARVCVRDTSRKQ